MKKQRRRRRKKKKPDPEPLTWRQFDVICASCGLKPFEADMMSMEDVFIMIEGYELAQRAEWERFRDLMYVIYATQAGKKAKRKETVFPLPWDKKGRMRASTPAEIMRQHEEMKRLRESKPQIEVTRNGRPK